MMPAPARGADLRLARLHLRGGTSALARSELETLAGVDRLDRDGILDLAEVRWRTGDLPGAAAAAAAWLEDGDDEPGPASALAHAISAEAAAERGAVEEAAGHVEAAAAWLGDRAALDVLLAGVPVRAAWPWEDEQSVALPGESGESGDSGTPGTPGTPGAEAAAAGPAVVLSALPLVAGPAEPAPPAAAAGGVPLAQASWELVEAGRSLLAVAPERAAILLALGLRTDRAAAEAILEALDAVKDAPGAGEIPVLAFVRAEALRAAGRHEESRIAYASAERLALAPAEAGPPGSSQ
jgi:tetratricopeptide (TPR) repeat protein